MTTAPPPALQHPGELAQLVDLYRDLAPQRVLEVGTFHGGTLYHWLTTAPTGSLIVAVDTTYPNQHLHQQWASERGTTVITVHGDSRDPDTIHAVTKHGPYDFVFIDADHHLDAVRHDWHTYSKLTRPGGVVALHDITPTTDPTIEVDQLWAELNASHETTEFVEPGGYGIGVVYMP